MPRWRTEICHLGLTTRALTIDYTSADQLIAVQEKLETDMPWVAAICTERAEADIRSVQTLLHDTIAFAPNERAWDWLSDTELFSEPPPPPPRQLPQEPEPPVEDSPYWNMFPRELPKRKAKYEQQHAEWRVFKARIEAEQIQYAEQLDAWNKRKHEHSQKSNALKAEIQNLAREDPGVIELALVLFWGAFSRSRPHFPVFLAAGATPKVTFVEAAKTLVVDYSLPTLFDIPEVKNVRYVSHDNEFKEIHLRKSERDKLYEDLLYQLCLAMMRLVFLQLPTPLRRASISESMARWTAVICSS